MYFYRHTNPYQKKDNVFSIFIRDIIFYSKDFPFEDSKSIIDFTSKNNEYDNILNLVNAKDNLLYDMFSLCNRDTLIFNRISNINLESIISNTKNNYIKTLYLKSNKLKEFPNFSNFSNLLTLNLTANLISNFDIRKLPISIKSFNIGKNSVSSMVLTENTKFRKNYII